MKKIFLVLVLGVLLIGVLLVGVLVGARMTFVDEDDGIYNMYENDIVLEKGWNLVHFGVELMDSSEIQEEDIKAVYYYNFMDGKYVRVFPESEEFNELIGQNSCGDGSCQLEERTDYSSWCSQDCYNGFSEDIMSHLTVISEKNVVLAKGEKATIDFIKNEDMEVYFSDDYNGGGLDLQHTTTNSGGGASGICAGHEDDYNLLRTYGKDQSKIYVNVDCSGDKKSLTFYEVDDSAVNPDESLTPSFQAKLISQPAWVYSNKRGLMKSRAVSVKMELNPLKSGWNFITITPEFDGKSWSQISQDCDVSSAYVFDAEGQDWVSLTSIYSSGTFGEAAEQGQGIAVKVSRSCILDGSGSNGGSSASVPSLPGSSGGLIIEKDFGGLAVNSVLGQAYIEREYTRFPLEFMEKGGAIKYGSPVGINAIVIKFDRGAKDFMEEVLDAYDDYDWNKRGLLSDAYELSLKSDDLNRIALWPSGNYLILIHSSDGFHGDGEDMADAYLEKYPSTLV